MTEFFKRMTTYGKCLVGLYILLLIIYMKCLYILGYKPDGKIGGADFFLGGLCLLFATMLCFVSLDDFHKDIMNGQLEKREKKDQPINKDELEKIQMVCVSISLGLFIIIPLFKFLFFVW